MKDDRFEEVERGWVRADEMQNNESTREVLWLIAEVKRLREQNAIIQKVLNEIASGATVAVTKGTC